MGEKAFDLADLRSAQEREAALMTARAIIERKGSEDCVECGAPISGKRRAAAPFALRCVMCQTRHEHQGSRR